MPAGKDIVEYLIALINTILAIFGIDKKIEISEEDSEEISGAVDNIVDKI